jgi:hypothetical protein
LENGGDVFIENDGAVCVIREGVKTKAPIARTNGALMARVAIDMLGFYRERCLDIAGRRVRVTRIGDAIRYRKEGFTEPQFPDENAFINSVLKSQKGLFLITGASLTGKSTLAVKCIQELMVMGSRKMEAYPRWMRGGGLLSPFMMHVGEIRTPSGAKESLERARDGVTVATIGAETVAEGLRRFARLAALTDVAMGDGMFDVEVKTCQCGALTKLLSSEMATVGFSDIGKPEAGFVSYASDFTERRAEFVGRGEISPAMLADVQSVAERMFGPEFQAAPQAEFSRGANFGNCGYALSRLGWAVVPSSLVPSGGHRAVADVSRNEDVLRLAFNHPRDGVKAVLGAASNHVYAVEFNHPEPKVRDSAVAGWADVHGEAGLILVDGSRTRLFYRDGARSVMPGAVHGRVVVDGERVEVTVLGTGETVDLTRPSSQTSERDRWQGGLPSVNLETMPTLDFSVCVEAVRCTPCLRFNSLSRNRDGALPDKRNDGP